MTRPARPLRAIPRSAALPLLALAAAMGGCWSTPAPTFTVSGVTHADATPDGVLMMVQVEAESTAEDALPLREINYRVSLDGREVFRGARSPEATIRRFGTQTLSLPVVFPAGVAVGASPRYEVSGTVKYAEPGTIAEVLLDLGVRTPSVSFSGAGTVSPSAASSR